MHIKILRQARGHWQAYFAGNPECAEDGHSIEEAIGKLMQTYGHQFGVEIDEVNSQQEALPLPG